VNTSLSFQVVSCFRFMRLFGTSSFSVVRISTSAVSALVAWPEDCHCGVPSVEDTQQITWEHDSSAELSDCLTVGEFAHDAGWICSDIINVSETELKRGLQWHEERVRNAVTKLLSLRVRMVDDGVETDFFFLHT